MVLTSFKTIPEFLGNPYALPQSWACDDYTRAWQDAHISITLPNTVLVTTVAVLISPLLAATLPRDLVHAAQVDVATEWQIFRLVILPLMQAGLISVMILNGVWIKPDDASGHRRVHWRLFDGMGIGVCYRRGIDRTGRICLSPDDALVPIGPDGRGVEGPGQSAGPARREHEDQSHQALCRMGRHP